MPTRQRTSAQRLISLPVSFDQLAFTIGRLSRKDLNALEFAFEPETRKEVLRRRRAVRGLARRGKTLNLSALEAEFGTA